MAITLVQDVGYSDNPGTVSSITIDITSTGGNTLTIAGDLYSGSALPVMTSVTDSAGNTWEYSTSDANFPPYAGTSSGANYFISFAAYSIAANAVTSVTLNFDGDQAFAGATLDVSEWSGVTAADTGAAGEGTATATSPGTITLAGAGELVIGVADYLGSLSSEPSGATELSSATGLAVAGYQVFAGSGSQAFQWGFTESDVYTVALLALQGTAELEITTSSLPTAVLGQPYSTTVEAANGTTPYTWSISVGSLPGWASLNTSTGVISGTAPGGNTGLPSTSFTIKVTDDDSNTATQPLVLSGYQPVGSPTGGPWTLVFEEDFTAPVAGPKTMIPNPAVWADHLVWGDLVRAAEGTTDWSWASHNDVGLSVSGSVLSIIARFESPYDPDSLGYDPLCPDPTDAGQTASYTSGIATTAPGFACSYGYFEASISIPVDSDVWPSFFMVSRTGNWGPEVDIMEFLEGESTSTLWAQEPDPAQLYHVGSPFDTPDIDSDYHVWGLRWSPDDVTFFFDGTQYGTYTTSADIPDWPMVMQLVMQIPQSDTSDGFPCDLNFEYVRAWVVSGVPAQPVITSVSPATGIPSGGSITVEFGAVDGATSYRATSFPVDLWAYYIDNDETNPNTPDPATGDSSPITISGFTDGVPYVVSVAAVNETGYSIESLPDPPLYTPPSPPAAPAVLYSMRMMP